MPTTLIKRIRKFYLCSGLIVRADELAEHPKSHIMGEVRHIGLFGQKKKSIASLALYESSRLVTDVPEMVPEIRMDIVGDALHIRCTLCSRKRRWTSSRAALAQRIALFETQT